MRYTRVKDKNGEIHLAAFEKEDKVFFLDELFPELKGKSLIDFIHMVNGDPQKAAQMICAADGSVHRMEEQKNMYLDIPYLMIFLQEICRPDMDSG